MVIILLYKFQNNFIKVYRYIYVVYVLWRLQHQLMCQQHKKKDRARCAFDLQHIIKLMWHIARHQSALP